MSPDREPTQTEAARATLMLARFCERNGGIHPGELHAAIGRMLNQAARGASVLEPAGYLRPQHFPAGAPLNPDDGGMGMLRVEKRADGNVYLVLGQMVANWFALTPGMARDLARALAETADGPADARLKAGTAPHSCMHGQPWETCGRCSEDRS